MAQRMFSGFGGGFSDPFANDPFFSRGASFGNIEKLMNDAHANMSRLEGGNGNRFQIMKYSNSTTIGKDGKPIKETF